MKIDTVPSHERYTIRLSGRFDFPSHKDFRTAMDGALGGSQREIQIDFEEVEYLDSAALGMLLMADEKAKALGKTVALANCRGAVRQVLDIANFGKLFRIS